MDAKITEFIRGASDLAPCVAILVTDRNESGQAVGVIVGSLPAERVGRMMGIATARIVALMAKAKSALPGAGRRVFEVGFAEGLMSMNDGKTCGRVVTRDPTRRVQGRRRNTPPAT